jgi:hypothetical protein
MPHSLRAISASLEEAAPSLLRFDLEPSPATGALHQFGNMR